MRGPALKDWDSKRAPFALPTGVVGDSKDPAWDAYLHSCGDYLRRQITVYQNWPQRRFGVMGYLNEKVFTDMNA